MELAAAGVSRLLELLDIDGRLTLHARSLAAISAASREFTMARVDDLLDRRLELAPPATPAVWPPLYYLAHQDHSWGRT